ncbi:hypothetical protein [Arthrobacter sp. NEB 688]|uniref:YqeB family protein n=1 Tax=Arthrobacter sp. NEB 688 TaxID=904039 RepID=UPI0015661B2A|nr:hypothetical protein [Arthrobacter sp. NEB 688]QKE83468.1 hypothetical protein HL663_05590 [Arthrobacter sp. NEB 688]
MDVPGRSDEDDVVRRVGGFDTGGRAFVLTLFGGGGLALGLALPWLARLAAEQEWVPFGGPLRALGAPDAAWLPWGRPVIGLAVGLVLAAWVLAHTAVLHVSRAEVRVERYGSVQRVIPRERVDGVHRDGGKVVLEAASGRVLFRDDVEGDRDAVRAAFVDAGYPWEGPPA